MQNNDYGNTICDYVVFKNCGAQITLLKKINNISKTDSSGNSYTQTFSKYEIKFELMKKTGKNSYGKGNADGNLTMFLEIEKAECFFKALLDAGENYENAKFIAPINGFYFDENNQFKKSVRVLTKYDNRERKNILSDVYSLTTNSDAGGLKFLNLGLTDTDKNNSVSRKIYVSITKRHNGNTANLNLILDTYEAVSFAEHGLKYCQYGDNFKMNDSVEFNKKRQEQKRNNN